MQAPLQKSCAQHAAAAVAVSCLASCDCGNKTTSCSAADFHRQVADRIQVPFAEVDAHNIVPVWRASDKREYGARTIRHKIHKQLPEFLREYPDMPRPVPWPESAPQSPAVDWEVSISHI
eukprot:GHUV01051136.1.p2 GENE.GHUV01051136.1~~GHUV01051136.1.p2  ORF type:complete len:120 (-),score=22.50 GHUV01051136.1:355-714(-)